MLWCGVIRVTDFEYFEGNFRLFLVIKSNHFGYKINEIGIVLFIFNSVN